MRGRMEPTTRRWAALALLCAAQFIDVLGVTVVIVALPSIGQSLGLSGSGLQWVASSYALFFGGFLMVCGRASDLYGRRRLFAAGLAVFTAASLACGLATSGLALILARAVQGLGAAIAVPAALSMLTELFPEGSERDRAVGVWTAVAAGGGAAGFFLGGVITDALGWRWVFLLNVPVGVVGLVLTRVLLEEGRDASAARRLDLSGATTITAGLVLLISAFTRAGDAGFRDPATLGLLTSALVLILAFLWVEDRAANPLIPLGVFRLPDVSSGALAAFTLTATTSSAGVLGALYLQEVLGYSPTATGLAYAPSSLSVIAGSLTGSWLAGKLGLRTVMTSGLLMVAVAMLVTSGISADGGLAYLLAGIVVSGLGLGCASVAATSAGVSAVAEGERGLASGLLNTAAQVGTALGIAALLAFAAARAGSPATGQGITPEALVEGYRAAYFAATVIATLGLLGTMFLFRRPNPRCTRPRGW